MGKRRRFRFPQGINGVDRYFYPHRSTPPDVNGTRYFDISAGYMNGSEMYSPTDTLGSYTGVPTDDLDQPIQDADDL